MSIGATLAAARRRAGMTVGEVSRSTRVTEPIIRGIEQDDYAACGGDFYARGHIRAIARAVGQDPAPLIDEFDSSWRSSPEVTAAEIFQPGLPMRTRERRRVRWTAFLAIVVLAVLGFAGYKFISGANGVRHASAAPRPSPPAGHASPPATAPGVQGSSAQISAATSSPPPSVKPAAVQALAPARVAAFGPAGTSDGDDPQGAAQAIAGHPAAPWSSDWYTTSHFGNLQAGTGLLLDMGHQVTVSAVRVWLTSHSGADLQLLAGARPVPSWLLRVASAANAGGTVPFRLSVPVRARYLVVWFTSLPPDASGTYQAGVYRITVEGQPLPGARGDLPSRDER